MELMPERYHQEQNSLAMAEIRSHDVVCLEHGIPIPEGHLRLVVHLWHPPSSPRDGGELQLGTDATRASAGCDRTERWDFGNEFGIRACIHEIGDDIVISEKATVYDLKCMIAADERLFDLLGRIGMDVGEVCEEEMDSEQAGSVSQPKVGFFSSCEINPSQYAKLVRSDTFFGNRVTLFH
jgi:hypothetical protein